MSNCECSSFVSSYFLWSLQWAHISSSWHVQRMRVSSHRQISGSCTYMILRTFKTIYPVPRRPTCIPVSLSSQSTLMLANTVYTTHGKTAQLAIVGWQINWIDKLTVTTHSFLYASGLIPLQPPIHSSLEGYGKGCSLLSLCPDCQRQWTGMTPYLHLTQKMGLQIHHTATALPHPSSVYDQNQVRQDKKKSDKTKKDFHYAVWFPSTYISLPKTTSTMFAHPSNDCYVWQPDTGTWIGEVFGISKCSIYEVQGVCHIVQATFSWGNHFCDSPTNKLFPKL